MKTVKAAGSGHIFQNRYLELLTKTHPAIIYLMYIPACLYSLYYHYSTFSFDIPTTVIIGISGMAFWSLAEYLLHRFTFHFINESKVVKRVHYTIHGVHHEYPNDRSRTIMPPIPSLLFTGFFFLLYWLILGNAVFAFLPGFVLGYLAYTAIHYSIHAFQPPFAFLRPLWRHHHIHHHRFPEKAFGVSSRLWDFIFGTLPPSAKGSSNK